MIVPGKYANSGRSAYTLPMGSFATFIDLSSGTATIHTGSLGFSVSDAAAFVNHPKAFEIATAAIAAGLTGVLRAWIRIMSIVAGSGGRRLYDSSFRRLTTQAVTVNYKVLIPSTYTGTFQTSSFNQTALTSTLQSAARANGMTNFAVNSAVTVGTIVPESVAGTEGVAAGGVSPMARISALLTAILMLAGWKHLA